MLVVTLVVVAIAAGDVVRRPRSSWTSERERAAWLLLLSVSVAVSLLSFSAAGPLTALVVVVAYCALRRGRDRATSG